MAASVEGLLPLDEGPPLFHERQVTPEQLLDMRLGYLSNMGAKVELVVTGKEWVERVIIAAVGATYFITGPLPDKDRKGEDRDRLPNERPDGTRLATQEEIATWRECDFVTFYSTSTEGDSVRYDYGGLSYVDLGLAPVRDKYDQPAGWLPDPIWHLRWPDEAEANQSAPLYEKAV